MQNNIALNFNLNVEDGKKKMVSTIVNKSYDYEDPKKMIWELTNYKDETRRGKGEQVFQGDLFKIGRQIIKLKFLNNKNQRTRKRGEHTYTGDKDLAD